MRILLVILIIFISVISIFSSITIGVIYSKGGTRYKCNSALGKCEKNKSGKYKSLKECENNCINIPKNVFYTCNKGECIKDPNAKQTLFECQKKCHPYSSNFGKNLKIRYSHPDFSVNKSRTSDLNKLNVNPSSNLSYLKLSTKPSIDSYGFEQILEKFKFNRLLLGNLETNPQPNSKYLSKYLFWKWRIDKYIDGLNIIKRSKPGSVVLLADSDDVTIINTPDIILEKFMKFRNDGFKIVLSGQVYCCNIDRVKFFMKMFNIPDEQSLISAIDGKEDYFYKIIESMWNLEEDNLNPGLTWTTEGKEIVNNLKNLSELNINNSPYRYINAGTIIGEVDALLKLYKDIKNDLEQYTLSLDDEGSFNLWYADSFNRNNIETKAIIDYGQEIFCVVDELETRPKERQFLVDNTTDEFTKLRINSSGEIINQYDKKPDVFHYAGYKYNFLQGIRKWVIFNAPKLKWLKSSTNKHIINFMEEIKRCGNKDETQENEQICNHLKCNYDSSLKGNNRCTLPDNPIRTYNIWEEDWMIDYLKSNSISNR